MKKRTRDIGGPDITPLIDVVFLLLIFFMVSTVFKKDELALLLNLPKASQGTQGSHKKKKTSIELSSREVALNGRKTDLKALAGLLDEIGDKEAPVDVRIDKDVRYDRLVKLLDLLKKKNLTNLGLITDS